MFFMKIPDNMALGVQQCLDTCKIQRSSQPTGQLQPRVSGNAFPSLSGASWSPSATAQKRSLSEENDAPQASTPKSPLTASINDLIFMLKIVVSVMLLGYVVIGANYVLRRRGNSAIELPVDEVRQAVKN